MSSTAYQWVVSISQFPKLLIISKPKKKSLRYPHRKMSDFNHTLSLRKRLEYWTQIVKICSVIRLCTPFNYTFKHYSSYLSHRYTNKLTPSSNGYTIVVIKIVYFIFCDTRFFALYWTPTLGILLNPKGYTYIS